MIENLTWKRYDTELRRRMDDIYQMVLHSGKWRRYKRTHAKLEYRKVVTLKKILLDFRIHKKARSQSCKSFWSDCKIMKGTTGVIYSTRNLRNGKKSMASFNSLVQLKGDNNDRQKLRRDDLELLLSSKKNMLTMSSGHSLDCNIFADLIQ